MRVVMFYHSLVSDWNHGNAHFLRGVASELLARGVEVAVYEPHDAWSVSSLLAEQGSGPVDAFHRAYPSLRSERYDPATLDLDAALDGADLVLVHEWNSHSLVARIGLHRRDHDYRLLFHDTHHRAVSDEDAMAAYDLRYYDGVLAFGDVIRHMYEARGWAAQAWTWHEAADTRVFHPIDGIERAHDLVWIGNWGDDERTAELHEFLVDPARDLALEGTVHGVRYPADALAALGETGLRFAGWLPNFAVPRVFAAHRFTVHVPRGPYVRSLPGIPTIRPFEALACGIPLISAPWDDVEGLFRPGIDFLVAANGAGMRRHMRDLLHDPGMAAELAVRGRERLLSRHTCSHRVDELLRIHASLAPAAPRSIHA
ncbi:glycosyltransferase [Luteibacter sp. 329MFSha]|uniref:CgeB family protein n=1 Tax=Luteibacter sp. 329MFSha TaxID=1798239 RepID=UPI000B7EC06D|nr:glycosyltransferase [Luteibacter sp. 329MFSha]